MYIKPPKNPVAILFDFDGVLLNSIPLHIEGWQHALTSVFSANNDKLAKVDWGKLKGLNSKKISAFIAEYMGEPKAAPELVQAKIDYILGKCAPMYDGAIETIQFFQDKGCIVAIVSNASKEFIERHVREHKIPIETYFGYEDHIEPKPSPLAYSEAALKLGVDRDDFARTIVFEDTAHGVKAGAKAKMFVVGVCTNTPPSQLQSAGAKSCIQIISETKALFSDLV